jgi:hypothetical protein
MYLVKHSETWFSPLLGYSFTLFLWIVAQHQSNSVSEAIFKSTVVRHVSSVAEHALNPSFNIYFTNTSNEVGFEAFTVT